MKINIRPLVLVTGILLLVLSIGCQSNKSLETTGSTSAVASNATGLNATGPTPIPEQAKTMAQQFAREQGIIEKDWDKFHVEFDTWRGELVACEPSAAQQTFRGFASQFNDVNEKTLSLSRPSGARGLADELIEASQEEAAAWRRLRDWWQPGDVSLLEAVASKRVDSAGVQKSVEDKLADLQEGVDAESLEELNEFSDAFDDIQFDWEQFHGSYETLKKDEAGLESAAVLARIDALIADLGTIIASVKDLPSADRAEKLADTLARAADSQKKGLGELKSKIESLEEGASSVGAFEAFDGEVQESQDKLKETEKELKDLTEEPKDTAAVQDFAREFDEFLQSWNGFHLAFDDWMDSEGGCDRSEVIQTLGVMGLEFGRLADRVRDLPTASYLRPMVGLVVEAAEEEEEALRVLRQTWRPFGADVYKALDRQRADAGRSRRQASVGVQELLDRFLMSPQ